MESINVPAGATKEQKYQALLPQIFALIEGESDLTANLANISAALKQGMGFFWVGFYLVRKTLNFSGKKADPALEKGQLVLGPFQGPVACTRIGFGKGVCGKAWEQKRVLIVPDVEKFPGHIACSSEARSEIVVPFFMLPELEGETREVMGVLDVDSDALGAFDAVDEKYLTQLVARL